MAEQIDRYLEKTDETIKTAGVDPASPLSGQAQKVPFPTAYTLSVDQEDRLVNHILTRLTSLEQESGRNLVRGTGWYRTSEVARGSASFMGRRELFELMYHNQVDWRPASLGGIFEDSNLTVPITRRIARQMVARANNYFFSTDPWFSAYPQGASDAQKADAVEHYVRWKLGRSDTSTKLQMAVELAFMRGECIVKTTHALKEQIYRSLAKVLVDPSGKDILAQDGDYILEADAFDTKTIADENGNPVGMQTVLRRDGMTEMPATPIYEEKIITRKVTIARGPDVGLVYFKDFICPLNAPSVDEADIIAHFYDVPVATLSDLYQRKNLLDMSTEQSVLATKGAIDLIRSLADESGTPKSGISQAKTERGETTQAPNTENPLVEVAEVYMTYDADGDGILEEIMVLVDVKNRRALFYDYTANLTPDGRRPFTIIRCNPVDGRWYGIGCVEMFEPSQNFVDLTINRISFAQGGSGRVTFWQPDATLEGRSNPHLVLNNGGTYTLAHGKTPKDALEYVALPELKSEYLFKMVEFFLQVVQLESGVVNAGDQQFAGLDTAKLATGIRNIEKSGQEMFALYLSHLEQGVQQVLDRLVKLIFRNMDTKEVFTYLEGDKAQIGSITPDEVANLDMDVRLLLTRYRGEQILQSSTQGANLVQQFYAYPPVIQQKVASLYIQMLKALQIADAETIITPLDPSQVPQNPNG